MYISEKDWKKYIERLSALDKKAAELMLKYIQTHGLSDGFSNGDDLINYAFGLVTKFSEGAAALAAEMYDAAAAASGLVISAAEVASTPTYHEVAKAVNGTLKHSKNPNSVSNAIGRLVKRTGADTTLRNAERDGAEFAWIPSGDTCAFCIALASRGWQRMSRKALKNGHAEHIHANCDCTYAIRFDHLSGVRGYDPQKYEDMYYGAEGDTPTERINAIRRMKYADRKDVINAQKRAAYAKRVSSDLNKNNDPLLSVLGPAESSSPDEVNGILQEAAALGVEIKEDEERMAYSPGLHSGEPGQLIINKKDSIGAWRHERRHMIDDANDGFPGFAGLFDVERRARMEYNGYREEIKLARQIGRDDIAAELKRACKQEIKSIGGRWDASKLE